MKVPYVDIAAQNTALQTELSEALSRVVADGYLIGGREVEALESELAETLGASDVIALNSGTDALLLALAMRGIGAGDEVIVPSHSFLATANAVAWLGALPVFVDIDDETMCLDPTKVSAAITEATKAVIVVHLNGFPVDMAPFDDIAKTRGLTVIEDAAQAIGAKRDGRHVGSSGLGCFSLHPLKILGALGDAGFISLGSPEPSNASKVAIKDGAALRLLRNHGLVDRDHASHVGINSRLDSLQAAFLRVKLKHLGGWIEQRRAHAAAYRQALEGVVRLPPVPESGESNGGVFVVRHPKRDKLRAGLNERGVDAKIHYPIPIHRQQSFVLDCEARGTTLPVTDRVVDEILSLPTSPELSVDQRNWVIESVKAVARELDQ